MNNARRGLIAICVPAYSDWKGAMATAMASLSAYSAARGFSLGIVATTNHPVAAARNALVRRALEIGAAWIFFVDTDMTFPPDALERLIGRNVDICGVLYHKRSAPFGLVGSLRNGHAQRTGLAPAEMLGGGMLLVNAEIFRRLQAPWFVHSWSNDVARTPLNLDGEISEDSSFILRAAALGVPCWADLDLSGAVGHVGECVVSFSSLDEPPRLLDRSGLHGHTRSSR